MDTARQIKEGDILWEPNEEFKKNSNMTKYMGWLKESRNLNFLSYDELWTWSVNNLEEFWQSQFEYFHVIGHSTYTRIISGSRMPEIRWFEGSTVNYAEHVFRNATSRYPALIFQSETKPLQFMSWSELKAKVTAVSNSLKRIGVKQGDRVVAYVPNIPETVIIFLAAASLGAIWSSCSPDFGSQSVIDRFKQIEPKVLFAVDGYRYGGKNYNRRDIVQ